MCVCWQYVGDTTGSVPVKHWPRLRSSFYFIFFFPLGKGEQIYLYKESKWNQSQLIIQVLTRIISFLFSTFKQQISYDSDNRKWKAFKYDVCHVSSFFFLTLFLYAAQLKKNSSFGGSLNTHTDKEKYRETVDKQSTQILATGKTNMCVLEAAASSSLPSVSLFFHGWIDPDRLELHDAFSRL